MLHRIYNYLFERVFFKRQIEKFYLVFGGHIFFQTLRVAVQLRLFDLLKQNGSLELKEIAEKLSLQLQPTRIILLGLTSVGFIKKKGSRYSNSYLSDMLFVHSSPKKVIAYIELQHRVMYRGLYWLLESVKEYKNVGLKEIPGNEKTLYERLAHDPELEKIFQEAMQELSLHANKELANHLELNGVKILVDVGGGDGTNALALARKWPQLKTVVFDSETVCNIAIQNIKHQGLADRVSTSIGNAFSTPFPAGADSLMFCHFFTIWGESKGKELLKKCYSFLPKGGRVIIFNMFQDDNECGPLSAAVGSPYFLGIATGLGMLYTAKEYKAWFAECGFHSIQHTRLARDHGIIIGIK
ncbi:MAG: methyltransferase domain-containing protein [Deltaproteobacteria bacterium]|nr:methyltransferase domain-containing protein [Deltaproteobacteria bacterium]